MITVRARWDLTRWGLTRWCNRVIDLVTAAFGVPRLAGRRHVKRRTGLDPRRVLRERQGRTAELAAALGLLSRGYRILALRQRTPFGEVDLIAVRGRRLAFVEVKRRQTLADAETSLRPQQTDRLYAAAAHWIAKRPYYRDHVQGFDAVLVAPGHLPLHRPDALQPAVLDRRGRA
jgi:putative endonuclease